MYYYKLLNFDSVESYDKRKANRNYRHIMRCIHPDKCISPVAHWSSVAVNRAIAVLRDDTSRYSYDCDMFTTYEYPYDIKTMDRVLSFVSAVFDPAYYGRTFRPSAATCDDSKTSRPSSTTGSSEDPIVLDDDSAMNSESNDTSVPDEEPNLGEHSSTTEAGSDEGSGAMPNPDPKSASESESNTESEQDLQQDQNSEQAQEPIYEPEPDIDQSFVPEPDVEDVFNADKSEPEVDVSARDTRRYSTDFTFRNSIKKIYAHTIRRGSLLFEVEWNGFPFKIWETDIDMIGREKNGLAEYLNGLKDGHFRRFLPLVKRFPHLAQVL